jgi:hypothetical protein
MRIWAISPSVNSPENNDPGIIDPIAGDMSDWNLAGSRFGVNEFEVQGNEPNIDCGGLGRGGHTARQMMYQAADHP